MLAIIAVLIIGIELKYSEVKTPKPVEVVKVDKKSIFINNKDMENLRIAYATAGTDKERAVIRDEIKNRTRGIPEDKLPTIIMEIIK